MNEGWRRISKNRGCDGAITNVDEKARVGFRKKKKYSLFSQLYLYDMVKLYLMSLHTLSFKELYDTTKSNEFHNSYISFF